MAAFSSDAAKCATPLLEAWAVAPPSSSNETSSPVTALITSGPVMNMFEVPFAMMMKSVIMAKGTSNMFITGPEVIKAVTGEDVSFEELGGATAHAAKSGVAHFAASDEKAAIRLIRTVLSYLPSNNVDDPPIVETDDESDRKDPELSGVVPKEPDKPYDMRDVIGRVVDRGSWLEVQ